MVMVGVAVQVVAMDSQSAGHHHTLNGAPAAVLGEGRAAVVSVGFPGKQRGRQEVNIFKFGSGSDIALLILNPVTRLNENTYA